MIRAFLILLGLIPCLLQAQIEFSASSNARQILQGEVFEVYFTLKNVPEPQQFAAPDFKGLSIVSGPNRSYRTSFINGKSSVSISFSYSLLAKKAGKFTIGAASIEVDGKTVRSNELTIDVLARDKAKGLQSDGEDVFIELQIDSSHFYVGQQIVLSYKIYTAVDIQSFNLLTEQDFNGFHVQQLDNARAPTLKEVVDGRQYTTKVLRKIALFPQRTGEFTIEPEIFRVGIGKSDPFFGGVFSATRAKHKNITSNGLTISVKDPFQGAPDHFMGGVGSFRIELNLPMQTELTTDDFYPIDVLIVGNGDIKTFRPDELHLDHSMQLFDTKVLSERTINASDSIRSIKRMQFLYQPTMPGRIRIAPQMSYLDPVSNEFVLINDTVEVTVNPGQQFLANQERLQDDSLPFHQISTKPRIIVQYPLLSTSTTYWTVFATPWVMGLILLLWRRKHEAKEKIQLSDREVLFHELKSIRNQAEGNATERIAMALKRFLSETYSIDPANFSNETLKIVLQRQKVEENIQHDLFQVLEQLDLANYASVSTTQQIENVIQRIQNLISHL